MDTTIAARDPHAVLATAGPVLLLDPGSIGAVTAKATEAAARVRDPVPSAFVDDRGGQHGTAVAVIPVQGMIRHRASWFGISVGEIRGMLREALADSTVGAVVLSCDTPGGSVFGVPELADELRAARDIKPIVAAVDPFCASAGYFLASQATEVVVAPSGKVGSIGVLVMHTDYSGYDERLGIATTVIRTPERKAEANPYEPLTDQARDALAADVEAYYGMFVDAVAAGRGVDADTVRSPQWGRGQMLRATDAVAAGMADAVGTREDAIARAFALAQGRTTSSGTPTGVTGHELSAAAADLIPVDLFGSASVRAAYAATTKEPST